MKPEITASIIGAGATFITGFLMLVIAIQQLRSMKEQIVREMYGVLITERREILFNVLEDTIATEWLLKERLKIIDVPRDSQYFYCLTALQILHYEHVYYRYKKKLFPDELWTSWQKSMEGSFKSYVFNKIWKKKIEYVCWGEFRDWINSGCPEESNESNVKKHTSKNIIIVPCLIILLVMIIIISKSLKFHKTPFSHF